MRRRVAFTQLTAAQQEQARRLYEKDARLAAAMFLTPTEVALEACSFDVERGKVLTHGFFTIERRDADFRYVMAIKKEG